MPINPSSQKIVDLWVKQGLAAHYASVLQEPLPAEWLALLQQPADR